MAWCHVSKVQGIFRSPYFMILLEQIASLYLIYTRPSTRWVPSHIGVTNTKGTGFWTPWFPQYWSAQEWVWLKLVLLVWCVNYGYHKEPCLWIAWSPTSEVVITWGDTLAWTSKINCSLTFHHHPIIFMSSEYSLHALQTLRAEKFIYIISL